MDMLGLIAGSIVTWSVPRMMDALLSRVRSEGRSKGNRIPWLRWTLASAVGGGVGGFASLALGASQIASPGGIANWAAFGLALGMGQWLVLKEFGVKGTWVIASTLGWAVWSFFQASGAPGPLAWSFVGLVIGILQWMVLRRTRSHALWWIPANLVAWFAGGTLGYAFGLSLLASGVPFPLAWVLGWAAVAFTGSGILGFTFSWMRAPKSAPA